MPTRQMRLGELKSGFLSNVLADWVELGFDLESLSPHTPALSTTMECPVEHVLQQPMELNENMLRLRTRGWQVCEQDRWKL